MENYKKDKKDKKDILFILLVIIAILLYIFFFLPSIGDDRVNFNDLTKSIKKKYNTWKSAPVKPNSDKNIKKQQIIPAVHNDNDEQMSKCMEQLLDITDGKLDNMKFVIY